MRRWWRDLGRRAGFEQRSCECELGVDVAGGEQAVVADLHEAAGPDVLEKAADEFQRFEATHVPVARSEDDLLIADLPWPRAVQRSPLNGKALAVLPSATRDEVADVHSDVSRDHP